MNNRAIIGIIIVIVILTVGGCSTATPNQSATIAPGATDTPTVSSQSNELPTGEPHTLLSILKAGKLHWYEYCVHINREFVNSNTSIKSILYYKYEYDFSPYGDVSNAFHEKLTITAFKGTPEERIDIKEYYWDINDENFLGGHKKSLVEGQTKEEGDINRYEAPPWPGSFLPREIVGPYTLDSVTVPAGTYMCKKYENNITTGTISTWIVSNVPVPIKIIEDWTDGTTNTIELNGWG
jgi:hypothetical protein